MATSVSVYGVSATGLAGGISTLLWSSTEAGLPASFSSIEPIQSPAYAAIDSGVNATYADVVPATSLGYAAVNTDQDPNWSIISA